MNSTNKGFTLLEMAVVLIIIGLMLGAGLGVANSQIQSARIASTKQKEDAIRLALINFISRNNRLPCPAIATLAQGVAGYGSEVTTPGLCTGTVINGAVATGIVPWVSLGLSDENGSDGYYNRFTYQVTLTATNTTSKTISGLKGAISTHTATPVDLGAPAVGNQSNYCTPAGRVYNPCSAVVVIISHGNNGSGAYTKDGTQISLPTGADELENTNTDSRFVVKDYSINTANPFDDILMALSSTDLLTPLTINGSLKDYSSVMNDDFSNIKNAVIAYAVSNRAGAITPYSYPMPFNFPALPANTLIDPWGTNYQFQRNILTVDKTTVSSLSAVTIFSYGPDKVAGGNDDIIFVVSVNQLQDAFAKVGW